MTGSRSRTATAARTRCSCGAGGEHTGRGVSRRCSRPVAPPHTYNNASVRVVQRVSLWRARGCLGGTVRSSHPCRTWGREPRPDQAVQLASPICSLTGACRTPYGVSPTPSFSVRPPPPPPRGRGPRRGRAASACRAGRTWGRGQRRVDRGDNTSQADRQCPELRQHAGLAEPGGGARNEVSGWLCDG